MPTAIDTIPRIWVGSLTDYNAGILHGDWIDATEGIDSVYAAVQAILDSSPEAATDFSKKYGIIAEEYGIFDYEGFGAYRVGEYESLESVVKIAEAIAEHGDKVSAFLAGEGDLDRLDEIDDLFVGEAESADEYRAEVYRDVVIDQFKASLREANRFSVRPGALADFFECEIESAIDVEWASAHGYDDDVWFATAADGFGVYVFRYEA